MKTTQARTLKAALALTLAASALALPAGSAWSQDNVVQAQVDRWFALWSPGGEPFDWEAFRDLYSEDGILVVDDFGAGITMIRSTDDYLATWAPVMADGFASWTFAPDTLDIRQSGELAVATFFATGDGVTTDGERVRSRQQGTLVLEYDPAEQEWEIT